MSFVAVCRTTDPKSFLLGGVKATRSSRFETREDASSFLDTAKETHAKLPLPLAVEGEVKEVRGSVEIYSDGSTPGCNWGRAKEMAAKA